MSLKETIQNEIKEALKNHEEVRVLVLRGLISSINNKEIEKWTKLSKQGSIDKPEEVYGLSDEETMEVIFSEVKKRRESILEFEKGKRDDLVQKEKAELEILQKYLPEQMSQEEIKKLAQEIITKTGASEMKDMGKVLSELMPKVKGKAEGGMVSQIVKELLTK